MSTTKKGTHYLKTWPVFFGAILSGRKTFEVRSDDRKFEEDDAVVCCEWEPSKGKEREADGYTGREVRGVITYLLLPSDCASGAVNEGFVVFCCEWDITASRTNP